MQTPTATPGLAVEVPSFLASNDDDIAMTAIKIKKFLQKKAEGQCKFKGSKEGGRQEAGKGQNFKPVQMEKEALMTIDEGQINWVEQTADEGKKLISCSMAFPMNNEIGLGYGIKSNAEVLGYEEEISRGIFAFRETNAGYNDIPLYSRFKQVEYKGVPHPLSGDYTLRESEN
ncbi:hypothetical protein Tco_0640639 [Tanacetum coccineum]